MVRQELENPPRLLVICGATGSGKGELAAVLAERLGGEIVLADSRKIYRHLEIGTAKPDRERRSQIRYHLLDCCAPDEKFSVARYRDLADRAIAEIADRGHLPIVCGGTGLYIRALLRGIISAPARDDGLRARLLERERARPGSLYRQLREIDPPAARRIPPADLVRQVRALEVYLLTGRTITDLQHEHRFAQRRYPALVLAPRWLRQQLYQRIDARVERMLALGWVEEVRRLLERGLADTPALATVGYRQLVQHLKGHLELEAAVAAIKREHRRYARRQLVWFKAEPEVNWLDAPVAAEQLLPLVERFLGISGSSNPPE